MSTERWGHATSRDAETWSGVFLTRAEAIADGEATYASDGLDAFWIHSGHVVPVEAVMPDADDLIETMRDRAYDEAGEVAEEYPDLTPEARAELDVLLLAWARRHATPTFWVADGEAERIPVAPAPGERGEG